MHVRAAWQLAFVPLLLVAWTDSSAAEFPTETTLFEDPTGDAEWNAAYLGARRESIDLLAGRARWEPNGTLYMSLELSTTEGLENRPAEYEVCSLEVNAIIDGDYVGNLDLESMFAWGDPNRPARRTSAYWLSSDNFDEIAVNHTFHVDVGTPGRYSFWIDGAFLHQRATALQDFEADCQNMTRYEQDVLASPWGSDRAESENQTPFELGRPSPRLGTGSDPDAPVQPDDTQAGPASTETPGTPAISFLIATSSLVLVASLLLRVQGRQGGS